MPPLANNWQERRTEHRFYATFVTNIPIRNSERKDKLQYNTKKIHKMSNTDPTIKPMMNSGDHEG